MLIAPGAAIGTQSSRSRRRMTLAQKRNEEVERSLNANAVFGGVVIFSNHVGQPRAPTLSDFLGLQDESVKR